MLDAILHRYLDHCNTSILLDCHSGFGMRDQLWFPYAYRRRPIKKIGVILALKLLLDKTYPYHNYIFEPQSNNYLTHGDLWDYFYKRISSIRPMTFLPLTLELGSWHWIRKRPSQLLSYSGLFNPMSKHRLNLVLRRHSLLIDFLVNATINVDEWMPDRATQKALTQAAMSQWY